MQRRLFVVLFVLAMTVSFSSTFPELLIAAS